MSRIQTQNFIGDCTGSCKSKLTTISHHKSLNKKQELPVAAMFVNGSGRNEQSL
jgi:hypothetical protein